MHWREWESANLSLCFDITTVTVYYVSYTLLPFICSWLYLSITWPVFHFHYCLSLFLMLWFSFSIKCTLLMESAVCWGSINWWCLVYFDTWLWLPQATCISWLIIVALEVWWIWSWKDNSFELVDKFPYHCLQYNFLWNYVTEPIQLQVHSYKRTSVLHFEEATEMVPTLCLREVGLASNSKSYFKGEHAAKWNKSRN